MRNLTTAFFISLSCILLPTALLGDVQDCRDTVIRRLVVNAQNANSQWPTDPAARQNAIKQIIGNVFNPDIDHGCMALMLAQNYPKTSRRKNAIAFDQLRSSTQNLTQTGASTSNGGTTNLVSKNLAPLFLSLASEYGGITRSTSGQTTTLSGTLSGIPLGIESHTGAPLFAECTASIPGEHCINPNTLDKLSRVSYAFAFGTTGTPAGTGATTGSAGIAQGNVQPVALSGVGSTSGYSLTQATGKFAILRQFPNKSALKDAAGKIDSDISDNLVKQSQKLNDILGHIVGSNDPAVKAEIESAATSLLEGYPADVSVAWDNAARHFGAAMKDSGQSAVDAIVGFLEAIDEYTAQEDLVTQNAYKPTLSFEYDLNRPASQPSNSTFKLIGAWSPGSWTITLNAAGSIYNGQPSASIPSAQRLRDVQLAAEADYKLHQSIWLLGNPTFTTAFYYQDQTSPAILNVPISSLPITGLSPSTNQVFTQNGPIDIGQFKISFGSSTSGLSVPLSVTVANRSELLTGMDVRGQVGISFVFDSLLSK